MKIKSEMRKKIKNATIRMIIVSKLLPQSHIRDQLL